MDVMGTDTHRSILLGLWGDRAVSDVTLRHLASEPDRHMIWTDTAHSGVLAAKLRPSAQRRLHEALGRGVEFWAERGRTIQARLARVDVQTVVRGDRDYPETLAACAQAPPILAIRGSTGVLSQPAVAVVGTRRASPLGMRLCRRLAEGLVAFGWVVVSGGALGIDAVAHGVAVEHDAPTVVVCGTGLDVDYPTRHAALYRRVEKTGALVSPFPLGTPPQPHLFPRRNATIAGLSLAVILVEVPMRSGALHTSRAALGVGRPVLVVPGPAFEAGFAGGHALARTGKATLADSMEAIADALRCAAKVERVSPGPLFERPSVPKDEALSPGSRRILAALALGTHTRDELVAHASGEGQVAQELLELELSGWIERLPGERYACNRTMPLADAFDEHCGRVPPPSTVGQRSGNT